MKKLLLLFLITIAAFSLAQADIPKTIHFQGRLTDLSGNPVDDGGYGVTFNIWDAESGGHTLWTGSYTINTKEGYYNTELGASPNAFPAAMTFDQPYYLDLQISGDPDVLSPRIKLNSSAYAMNVADGAIITAKIKDSVVTEAKIVDGAVSTNKLGNNSVTTAKIMDLSVTNTKIANSAITNTKIADGAIDQTKSPRALFSYNGNNQLIAYGTDLISPGASGVTWWNDIALRKALSIPNIFLNTPLVMISRTTDDLDANVTGEALSGGTNVVVFCSNEPTTGSVTINWIAVGEKK